MPHGTVEKKKRYYWSRGKEDVDSTGRSRKASWREAFALGLRDGLR